MRTMIAAAVAVAVMGVSQSGMAGMAAAEKWVDSEFQPSTLSTATWTVTWTAASARPISAGA